MMQINRSVVECDTALSFMFDTIKCFLCDCVIGNEEDSIHLFKKRLEQGQLECSLSSVLSSALSREIEESTAHSQSLCSDCYSVLLEYENIEQQFYHVRYKIWSCFNTTAKRYNLEAIPFELDVESTIDINKVQDSDIGDNSITVCNRDTDSMESIGQDDIDELEPEGVEMLECNADVPQPNIETSDINDSESNGFIVSEILTEQEAIELEVVKPSLVNNNLCDDGTIVNAIDGLDVVSEDIIYEQIIEQNSNLSYDENGSIDNQSLEDQSLQDGQSNSAAEYSSQNDFGSIKPKRISRQPRNAQHIAYELKDGKYFCLLCTDKTEYGPKLFPNHLRTVHNLRFFICDFCNMGFSKRQDLNDHMDEGHPSMDEHFECDVCQRKFENYRLFRIHKRQHYTSACKQFQCSECKKKYSSLNLLEEHMNMHTGNRPFKCAKCPKDFASKYTLQAHAKIHTERERPFQCDECDKAFFNQQNLLQHKKIHSGVKSFICDICSKAFGTQHNLDVHKIVHSGNKPFICRMCDKAFARRAEIRDHERTHTGEKPFKCDICGMAFAQRSNLSTHKKTTHLNDKRHKCSTCERSFKRRRLLDYHIQSAHTGERPFKCDICSSTFVYPEHFKKHLLIHSGVKPYSCEVCGKSFNSRDNRNAHRFTHSDKKPYECLICGAGFMRKPQLLAHMKNIKHNNDTIIINQPQINVQVKSEEKSKFIVNDKDLATVIKSDDIESEESYNDEEFLIGSFDGNNVDMSAVAEHYIKNEMGDVKYLQFADIDKDGQHTLTWVDLGAKD